MQRDNSTVSITTRRHYDSYLYQRDSTGGVFTKHPDTLSTRKPLIKTITYYGTLYEFVGVMQYYTTQRPFERVLYGFRIEAYIHSRKLFQKRDLLFDEIGWFRRNGDRYKQHISAGKGLIEDDFLDVCYGLLNRLNSKEKEEPIFNNLLMDEIGDLVKDEVHGFFGSWNRYHRMYHFVQIEKMAEDNPDHLEIQRLYAICLQFLCKEDQDWFQALQELSYRYPEYEDMQVLLCETAMNLSFKRTLNHEMYFDLYTDMLESYQEYYAVQELLWKYSLNTVSNYYLASQTGGVLTEADWQLYSERCYQLENMYPDDYHFHDIVKQELETAPKEISSNSVQYHIAQLHETMEIMKIENPYYMILKEH